jgi:hypothetical protein
VGLRVIKCSSSHLTRTIPGFSVRVEPGGKISLVQYVHLNRHTPLHVYTSIALLVSILDKVVNTCWFGPHTTLVAGRFFIVKLWPYLLQI